jgi:hypothetical protein
MKILNQQGNNMKTLLSLFDYSGQWSQPFADAGWNIIQLDEKHGFDINTIDCVETCFDLGIDDVDGIIAAPPCTDFANSGAQYWAGKDANGTTAQSLQLVSQVLKLVDLFKPTDIDYDGSFFWCIENPAGRLHKLAGLGKGYYFHPYEFAGHLQISVSQYFQLSQIRLKDGKDVTAAENQFVLDTNTYTKKTGLWGDFNRAMVKKPIPPVKTSKQGSPTQRLGGSSDKTKELRSHTPLGFANAFYQANHNYISPSLLQI